MNVSEHVPAVSGILSVAALALVFAAALQAVPQALLPRAPDAVLHAIPHLNAAVSATAVGAIVVGWRAVRRGDVARHRVAMLATTGLFAAFLVAYLYRVALLGPVEFSGPPLVEGVIYPAILGVHVALAVVCVPLVIYVLLLAVTRPVPELRETHHRTVGRVAAALWLLSFSLGVVVYLMLYVLF